MARCKFVDVETLDHSLESSTHLARQLAGQQCNVFDLGSSNTRQESAGRGVAEDLRARWLPALVCVIPRNDAKRCAEGARWRRVELASSERFWQPDS